jgi:hypothetical protein
LVVCAGAAFTGAAFAQDEFPAPSDRTLDNLNLSGHGGVMYQFDTDLDKGGDFNVVRAGLGLTSRIEFDQDLSLSLRGDYQLDYYDFSNNGIVGGADLWDDIHTISLGAILHYEASDDWEVFAGPVLQFSFEGGADVADAVTFGGIFGAAYTVSDSLTIGGGLGITSQIEDDVRLFPVFIVNWQITDRLAMRNSALIGAGNRDGVELIYTIDDHWEAALGGGYTFNRFRVDGASAFNDGVGQDSSIPIWARLTYAMGENVRISFYGGVLTGGELRVQDDDGDSVANSDYDPAPIVGLAGTIRF